MTNTKNNVISNEDYELDMKLEKYIKMICKKYDLVYKREYDEFGEYGFDISTKKRSARSDAKFYRAAKEIDDLVTIYYAIKYGATALPTQLAA